MAVAFNNAGTAVQGITSPTSDSFSVTAGGSNLCAFACLAYDARSGQSISGVTYGGVAMTSCGAASHDTTSHDYSEVWYLVNPPTGSNTLAVTVAGGLDDIYRNLVSYTGVDQTTPVRAGTYFNKTGSIVTDGSGNLSQTVTSAVGDLTLTCVNGGASNNITVAAGQTRRGNSAAGNRSFAHDDKTGAASVTHTWSGGGAGVHCSMMGFSIMAAGAAAATTPPTRNLLMRVGL